MGVHGFAEFHRHFLTEISYDGLIVDVRYNGGGHFCAAGCSLNGFHANLPGITQEKSSKNLKIYLLDHQQLLFRKTQ